MGGCSKLKTLQSVVCRESHEYDNGEETGACENAPKTVWARCSLPAALDILLNSISLDN